MSIQVRTVGDDDIPGWLSAVGGGFLRPPEISKEDIEFRRAAFDPERTQGAYDNGRWVATFRSFEQRLTVVGGARVRANAVTTVTVAATHRRRGLLSRMMTTDLKAAKERGDMVATLIAAEYPIYGRFGFGPATSATEWAVDVPRAGLDPRHSVPACGGRVDFASPEEVREVGPGLHDRWSARRPGAVSREDRWWERATGAIRLPSNPWTEPFHAVYRSADGEVQGLVTYRVNDNWEGKRPKNTATVDQLIATTVDAERALWQFLCSIDWVVTVQTGPRAPDDLLPHFLGDPRAAAVQSSSDLMWLRPLDVPRLLEARTYAASGELVLEVEDPAGLAGGRFLLDATPEGARCVPTTRTADLTLPVGELAPLYLGDDSIVRRADLGHVREERAGALSTADGLLRTGRRPWCPDMF
ncbi:GNAT family N-acetyltransferase [Streptomyces sp. NPDC003077]|uniref:GNAT family N-acetyltransferase n=1 Tax=Streptomyces sp. NPDC003077 TaxID=3154443 RepID=UPI00339FBF68